MNSDDPQTDLLAAAMFVAIGAGAIWIALDYPLGSMRRLGPGALPMVLGVLLLASGAGLALQAILRAQMDPQWRDQPLLKLPKLPSVHVVRSTLCVVAGLGLFGLLVRPAGLFLATATLVLVSSRAEAGTPIIGSLALAVIIPAACVGIFVYGIGLPFRVWP
ncbi:tripartite tricarboxylate transporter TctB family protein [Rhodobacteraceae bacterium 2376]|uniref:Tripartite tricarboxylate transporter TctB family protein n=1 Tax=Rhabdonatronobacter sediminivivens TaxID=2743469 RepID=A0A7Z0L0W8_9RHOB|nr:tripartite tricarboxylate transporter TctB family protein [Rhabdonatronobacter sediminivivens]NYS26481.1 tripartite tricarboxylate transporter TctB family protein [Rhabdonatronobacter sediminivivens]